jgi:hypothetical protein
MKTEKLTKVKTEPATEIYSPAKAFDLELEAFKKRFKLRARLDKEGADQLCYYYHVESKEDFGVLMDSSHFWFDPRSRFQGPGWYTEGKQNKSSQDFTLIPLKEHIKQFQARIDAAIIRLKRLKKEFNVK